MPVAPTPEVWALPPNYYEELDRAVRTQSDKIIAAAVENLKSRLGDTVEIESKAILGSPRRVILDEADSFQSGSDCRRLAWLSNMGASAARIGFAGRCVAREMFGGSCAVAGRETVGCLRTSRWPEC